MYRDVYTKGLGMSGWMSGILGALALAIAVFSQIIVSELRWDEISLTMGDSIIYCSEPELRICFASHIRITAQ